MQETGENAGDRGRMEGSITTEERAKKGDMLIVRASPTKEQEARGELGDIRFAQVQVRSVLNFFHERGHLNSQHVHDGQTYEIWQGLFNAQTGYRNNSLYSEIPGMRAAVSADGFDPDDFVSVIRSLSIEQKKAIEFAIHTIATDHGKWLAGKCRPIVISAFERLTAIMEPLRAAARDREKDKK